MRSTDGDGNLLHDWQSIYTPVPVWECRFCGSRHPNCEHKDLPKRGCTK